jgi:hypothetical protein
LDESGSYVIDSAMLSTSQELNRPLDLEQGADGALYVVDYGDGWHETNPVNTQIGRIEYIGSCRPGAAVSSRYLRGRKADVGIDSRAISIREEGAHVVRQSDVDGRILRTWKGVGPHVYGLDGAMKRGITLISVSFPASGKTVRRVVAIP